MNSITKTSLSTMPKRVHRKFLCVWVMIGKCKRKANVFKRCRSSEGVNSAGANKAALEDVQLKSQARLSWVSFLLTTALRNHSFARQIWKQQTKVSWIFLILCQTSHRRKTACQSVNWYSSWDSPRCAVKPCSVLWLWRFRLVLLKSCLISRPWNGGCGKVWQQQIKGEW